MTDSSSIGFGSVTCRLKVRLSVRDRPAFGPAEDRTAVGSREVQLWDPAPCVMASAPEAFRCEVDACRAGPRPSIDRSLPMPFLS